jgi:hypothetical protein
MREVSASVMRRLAGAELAERTNQLLDDDVGVALYLSPTTKVVIPYGTRTSECPSRVPPSHWGGEAVLDAYCPPVPVEAEMVSPVLKALRDPDRYRQIASPPRQPPVTRFPEFPRGR